MSSQGSGYKLGGVGGPSAASRASVREARLLQQRSNEEKIAEHLVKENEKQKLKLQKKIERYPFLRTAPGEKLGQCDSSVSLEEARRMQSEVYTNAIATNMIEEKAEKRAVDLKQKKKLEEKIERYAYLRTAPGEKLGQYDSSVSLEEARRMEAEAKAITTNAIEEKAVDPNNAQQLHSTSSQNIDTEKSLEEIRRIQQEKYRAVSQLKLQTPD